MGEETQTQGEQSSSHGFPVLDGPFEGATLTFREAMPAVVNLEGPGVPHGYVAKYRYLVKRKGFVFKGFDQVIARIPRPGGPS